MIIWLADGDCPCMLNSGRVTVYSVMGLTVNIFVGMRPVHEGGRNFEDFPETFEVESVHGLKQSVIKLCRFQTI